MNNCEDSSSFEFLRIYPDGKLMSRQVSLNLDPAQFGLFADEQARFEQDLLNNNTNNLGGAGGQDPSLANESYSGYGDGLLAEQLSQTPSAIYSMEFLHKYPNISNFRGGEASSQVKAKLKSHLGKKSSTPPAVTTSSSPSAVRPIAKKKTPPAEVELADPDGPTPGKPKKRKHKPATNPTDELGSALLESVNAQLAPVPAEGTASSCGTKKSKSKRQPAAAPPKVSTESADPAQESTAAAAGEDKQSSSSSKRMKTLPEAATNIMKEWFDAHRDKPYPTDDERRQMAIAGQISESQVKAWFANKRNRTNNNNNSNSNANASSKTTGKAAGKTLDESSSVELVRASGFPPGEHSTTTAADLYHSNEPSGGLYAAFNSPLLIEKTSNMSLAEIVNTPPLQVPARSHKSRADRYYLEPPQIVEGQFGAHLNYGYGGERRASDGQIAAAIKSSLTIHDLLASDTSEPKSLPEAGYFANHPVSGYDSCLAYSTNNECSSSFCHPDCMGYRGKTSPFIQDDQGGGGGYYQADYGQRRCSGQPMTTANDCCVGSYLQQYASANKLPHCAYPASPTGQVSFMNDNLNAINRHGSEMTFNSYNMIANRYDGDTCYSTATPESQTCYPGTGFKSYDAHHQLSLPDTPSGTYSNPVSSVSSVSSCCDLNMTSSACSSSSSYNPNPNLAGYSYFSTGDYSSPPTDTVHYGHPFDFLGNGHLSEGKSSAYLSGPHVNHDSSSTIEPGQPWSQPATRLDASGYLASTFEFNDTFAGQYQAADHSTSIDNLDLFVCDDFLDKDSRLLTKIIACEETYSSHEASSVRRPWLPQAHSVNSIEHETFQQHE